MTDPIIQPAAQQPVQPPVQPVQQPGSQQSQQSQQPQQQPGSQQYQQQPGSQQYQQPPQQGGIIDILRDLGDYLYRHKKGIAAIIAGIGVGVVITYGALTQKTITKEITLIKKDENNDIISKDHYLIFTNPNGTISGLRDENGDGSYELFSIEGKIYTENKTDAIGNKKTEEYTLDERIYFR